LQNLPWKTLLRAQAWRTRAQATARRQRPTSGVVGWQETTARLPTAAISLSFAAAAQYCYPRLWNLGRRPTAIAT
jgi:hypothetical protein